MIKEVKGIKSLLRLGRPEKGGEPVIGEMQHEILTTIRNTPEKAYSAGIAQSLRSASGQDIPSDGQVFMALKRMETRGLIEAAEPVKGSGRGRPRKFYHLTNSGTRTLQLVQFNVRSTTVQGTTNVCEETPPIPPGAPA